jgi:hypothetical protein
VKFGSIRERSRELLAFEIVRIVRPPPPFLKHEIFARKPLKPKKKREI